MLKILEGNAYSLAQADRSKGICVMAALSLLKI
jgi:hypothetical protein